MQKRFDRIQWQGTLEYLLHRSQDKAKLSGRHKIQERPSCVLNSFSERSLGTPGTDLSSGLVNSLCLKDYICVINPLYPLAEISKSNMLLIILLLRILRQGPTRP